MIPLHLHSNYSFLCGTLRIDDIITVSKKLNLPSVAITDTNGMYGVIQFAKKAEEENIKPIIGTFIDDPTDKNKYAIFLAKNNSGYGDICKIITQRKLNEDFSLVKILGCYWKNLIIITPFITLLKEINKQNDFYAELIPTKKNRQNALELFNYAKQNEIPFVASNPVYFLNKNDFDLHKLVTAIRLNKSIENLRSEELTDEEYYFKSPTEIAKQFEKIPQAIENSFIIAQKCNIDFDFDVYKYPVYPKLKSKSSYDELVKICFEGLKKRYSNPGERELKRLSYELDVIRELNFVDYFLIVWDIAREARRRGMMTIGRGSAANSLVAYCLELTQVDPIKHNLYFERFLNRARTNPPDVDLDFSWKERDEIVKYVFETYGYEKVAMISTTVTFRARSAFREVAKAFGLSDQEISKYSKNIPWTDAANLPNISAIFPESKNLNFSIEPWKSIINYAVRISNFPRHLSIHPGGIVITPIKITDYCALEYAKNKGLGLIVTQPDMYSIEELGLIKIDLLSQRSLGVLRDTMESIKNNYGKRKS
jgi:DNA-directed DNA polymerase III PolC